MQVEFLQDVAAISLDGVGADVESCCYFLVRLPSPGQKWEDLGSRLVSKS